MSDDSVDLTSGNTPEAAMDVLTKARQLNQARAIRMGQMGFDPSVPMMFNRLNFVIEHLLGPVETSPDRMKLELIWENQVLPQLFDAIETQLNRARLTAQQPVSPEDIRKIIDPRNN